MNLFAVFGRKNKQSVDIPELAPGLGMSVVGESFYSRAFIEIARSVGVTSSSEVEVDVQLHLDPKNPHSRSGKAIAVYVARRKVGHISEQSCIELYDVIVQRGMAARCRGKVFFDDFRVDRPRHSLTIFLDWPARFSDQAAKPAESVAFSKLDGDQQDELTQKREVRIRGEGPDLPELNPGDEINTEDVRGFDLKILEKTLKPHGIRVGRSSSARVHVVAGPDSWNSRVGLERLLKKDIPSVHLDQFLVKYPQFMRNQELEEAIVAARTWMDENPDFTSAEKATVEKAAAAGRLVLRGHAVVEGNPVDGGVSKFALYPARVMKEHRHNLKDLLATSGAKLYDKLLIVGDLERDQEKNRYYISVAGTEVCAMYAEQRDYFDIVTSAKRKDLLEISWRDKDEFSVKVFSFYFHF